MARVFPRLRVSGAVRRLVVLFGDQLDRDYTELKNLDRERDAVLMMEVADEATHVSSHRQRTVLFLAAMRHFALELDERNYRVQYVTLDERDNTGSFDGEFNRAVKQLKPEQIVCIHPGEWRVLKSVEGWQRDFDGSFEIHPDTHFYVQPDEFAKWAKGRKQLVMEYFYREQRRKLGILLNPDGSPRGGKWNYDDENREAFKAAPRPKKPYAAQPDEITQEVIALVNKRFPDAPGRIDSFRWPVTRTAALRALNDFIENRLPRFGTHQDAMWTDEPFLYHAILSAPINLKLLNPREVVQKALDAYESGAAPLNAVEGFVRQLIGWREFIRGVYWHSGPEYADGNALDAHGDLPELYWTGETDLNCLNHAVNEVFDHGFGHHIQRLMVTGNFALISGVHPRAVSDWYLGMYVDAIDWVTLPNTLGMALHADGGVVGTKPYAASGKYIDRMSNYCKGCRYDLKQRSGDDACPFNVFYWDFLLRQRERLADNHRMAMMLKNVDRMKDAEKQQITATADRIRVRLKILNKRD